MENLFTARFGEPAPALASGKEFGGGALFTQSLGPPQAGTHVSALNGIGMPMDGSQMLLTSGCREALADATSHFGGIDYRLDLEGSSTSPDAAPFPLAATPMYSLQGASMATGLSLHIAEQFRGASPPKEMGQEKGLGQVAAAASPGRSMPALAPRPVDSMRMPHEKPLPQPTSEHNAAGFRGTEPVMVELSESEKAEVAEARAATCDRLSSLAEAAKQGAAHPFIATNKSAKGTLPPRAKNHIKRPMNAFMIWAKERRQEVRKHSPKLHNAIISRELGAEWRALPESVKRPYNELAKQMKLEHRRKHPTWKFQPRRRIKEDEVSESATEGGDADASPRAAHGSGAEAFGSQDPGASPGGADLYGHLPSRGLGAGSDSAAWPGRSSSDMSVHAYCTDPNVFGTPRSQMLHSIVLGGHAGHAFPGDFAGLGYTPRRLQLGDTASSGEALTGAAVPDASMADYRRPRVKSHSLPALRVDFMGSLLGFGSEPVNSTNTSPGHPAAQPHTSTPMSAQRSNSTPMLSPAVLQCLASPWQLPTEHTGGGLVSPDEASMTSCVSTDEVASMDDDMDPFDVRRLVSELTGTSTAYSAYTDHMSTGSPAMGGHCPQPAGDHTSDQPQAGGGEHHHQRALGTFADILNTISPLETYLDGAEFGERAFLDHGVSHDGPTGSLSAEVLAASSAASLAALEVAELIGADGMDFADGSPFPLDLVGTPAGSLVSSGAAGTGPGSTNRAASMVAGLDLPSFGGWPPMPGN